MAIEEVSNNSEIATHDDFIKTQEIVSNMAELIALYEQTSQKIEQHKLESAQRLLESDDYFNRRLEEINKALLHMQAIMSDVDSTRFTVAAEKVLSDGQQHVETVQTASNQLYEQSATTLIHLEQAIKTATEQVASVANYVRYDEIRQVTLTATQKINETTDIAVRRLTGTLSWLHWERVSVIFIIALVVALTSSYLGGGWTSHANNAPRSDAQALQVGKGTLRAWPQLSLQDRELIKKAIK